MAVTIQGMRWLVLLVSVPTHPTRHRVAVWRKLKRMGAVNLQGAAWILPDTPETTELFQWLAQEVRTHHGQAALLHVDRLETVTPEEVRTMFHRARTPDYDAIIHGCRQLATQLDRHAGARHGAGPAFDRLRTKAEAVKRELDRVRAIDYLDAPAGRRALAQWEAVAKRLRATSSQPGRHRIGRGGALPPPGSTWVTRPRPHIDRIASAWLIKRFCDPDAKFAFADAADAARKGIPFDVLGADFGHHGEDCTFETLVKRFGLKDRRVRPIAEIVHEADLHDGKFTRNEATGVDLAINALVEVTSDDHDLLERGMAIFEGLYAVLKQKS
ncbi:MAG: chromate resistance protein [Candidatus Rokubacteria bacterium]|nr:chromate resistance protein [Candidatus Rokubacteria bacterium]